MNFIEDSGGKEMDFKETKCGVFTGLVWNCTGISEGAL
jgi:hypothetical protein